MVDPALEASLPENVSMLDVVSIYQLIGRKVGFPLLLLLLLPLFDSLPLASLPILLLLIFSTVLTVFIAIVALIVLALLALLVSLPNKLLEPKFVQSTAHQDQVHVAQHHAAPSQLVRVPYVTAGGAIIFFCHIKSSCTHGNFVALLVVGEFANDGRDRLDGSVNITRILLRDSLPHPNFRYHCTLNVLQRPSIRFHGSR
mmetsp:Transcript_10810/g.22196  ORF Transcript_10810/g.22196 Transcript_10810/m.22196 type:complete len:200 (+) Transcript_10810:309-908(+)